MSKEALFAPLRDTLNSLMLASRETLVVQNYSLLFPDELARVCAVKEVDLLCANLCNS